MHDPSRMMTSSSIRERLVRRRTDLLLRHRDELARADEVTATPEPEEMDRATEEWQARTLAHMGEVDARALEDVMGALRRLDAGTYGTCEMCEQPIATARLDALPEARTCIQCASLSETASAAAMSKRVSA